MSRDTERGESEVVAIAVFWLVVIALAIVLFRMAPWRTPTPAQDAPRAQPPTRRPSPRSTTAPSPEPTPEQPETPPDVEPTRPPLGDAHITVLDPITNVPLPPGVSKGAPSLTDPTAIVLKIRVSDEIVDPRIDGREPTSAERDGDITVLAFLVSADNFPTRRELLQRGKKGLLPLEDAERTAGGDRFVVVTYRLPSGKGVMPEYEAIFTYHAQAGER